MTEPVTSKRIAAYLRVSKRIGMTVENQRPIIENWIKNNTDPSKVEVHWFTEEESTRKELPEREKVIRLLAIREYDTLICVRLDRWGRSTTDIVLSIENIIKNNIRVIFIQNGFDWVKDTYNSTNKLQLDLLSSFANFERELISERSKEGLARAKAQGTKFGRPVGSKDKKTRRKSGYYMRWIKEREVKPKVQALEEEVKKL